MNIAPRDGCKAGDRLKGSTVIRDFFPRSWAAGDVCDLLLLGVLLVGAGTTTVGCSSKGHRGH